MKKFSFYISTVFRLFLIFSICFIWCRYFIKSLNTSIFSSIILTFLIDFIIIGLINKKSDQIALKKSEAKKAENFCNGFIFSDDNYAINFFLKLAKSRHNATIKNNYVLITHKSSNVALYPFFTYRSFTCEDLIFCYNSTKKQNVRKIVICANNVDEESKKLAKNLDVVIILLNKYEVYEKLMKPYNIFPVEFTLKIEPSTAKQLFQQSFSRKKTKGYIFSCMILLFSSFFIKLNIYYLIFSTFLLILALFSYFNSHFNAKINEEIL